MFQTAIKLFYRKKSDKYSENRMQYKKMCFRKKLFSYFAIGNFKISAIFAKKY